MKANNDLISFSLMPGVDFAREINRNYLVERINKNEAIVLEELSLDDVQNILASNKAMSEYQYFKRKRIELRLNQHDFQQACDKYFNQLNNISPASYDIKELGEYLTIDINRVFTNYINSCRIFIDHLDGHLKHKYGGNSIEYGIFKTAKNYCYDNEFSYKFFYHLRNYAEHENFPINGILIEKDFGDDKEEKPSILSIFFNRDVFLKSNSIPRKLDNDLLAKEIQIPVLPLVIEFEENVDIILDSLLTAERDYYTENINLLNNLYDKIKQDGNLYVLMFQSGIGNQIEMNLHTLWFDIVLDLVNEYTKLDSK